MTERPDQDASAIPELNQCLGNVARLLRAAEMETDLSKMNIMISMAGCWIDTTRLIHDIRE